MDDIRLDLRPKFYGPMDPVHPCREMPTRHCPAVFNNVCGDDRACARYESDDPLPWLLEIRRTGVEIVKREK